MTEKWGNDELEAMKGFIIYATTVLNNETRANYGFEAIDMFKLIELFGKLPDAVKDMTPAEAQAHYLHMKKKAEEEL